MHEDPDRTPERAPVGVPETQLNLFGAQKLPQETRFKFVQWAAVSKCIFSPKVFWHVLSGSYSLDGFERRILGRFEGF